MGRPPGPSPVPAGWLSRTACAVVPGHQIQFVHRGLMAAEQRNPAVTACPQSRCRNSTPAGPSHRSPHCMSAGARGTARPPARSAGTASWCAGPVPVRLARDQALLGELAQPLGGHRLADPARSAKSANLVVP